MIIPSTQNPNPRHRRQPPPPTPLSSFVSAPASSCERWRADSLTTPTAPPRPPSSSDYIYPYPSPYQYNHTNPDNTPIPPNPSSYPWCLYNNPPYFTLLNYTTNNYNASHGGNIMITNVASGAQNCGNNNTFTVNHPLMDGVQNYSRDVFSMQRTQARQGEAINLCLGGKDMPCRLFNYEFGGSIGGGGVKDSVSLLKIVKAFPKAETREDVKGGVQKFRVKMLAESDGQSTIDVLCQIGLDGIRMLDPSSSTTLKIYPLDTVMGCEVYDKITLAFWFKSSVDIQPRRIRLQSNSYTTNTLLDTVTAATFQVKEMVGRSTSVVAVQVTDQSTEKKNGLGERMNIIKPANEEKDYWEFKRNYKPSSGFKSEGSSKQMKKVACPSCTVHLQVQVPRLGSATIECGVCQHPFLVLTNLNHR